MKNSWAIFVALILGALGLAAPSSAHHGTAVYDTKHPVTLTGTVTEYRFSNPHVILFFDVKDAGGETQKWAAEIGAPNNLNRSVGWTSKTIQVGDAVTITGNPSKNGAKTMISTPERMVVNGKKILPATIGERAGGGGQQREPQ
jgi:hypothetical protein